MSRPIPLVLAILLIASTALLGGLSILKSGIYINKFEGDAFHLMDILTRMELGQKPHIDFQTPIGSLAFWPIAPFWGFGAGRAFAAGQLLVAVLLLPAIYRVALSRLGRGWAEFFALSMVVLVTAVTYGGDAAHVSVSMHYNRWAWAVASVAVVAAVLPPRAPGWAILDGVIVGLCFAALALLKATYLVALLPGVVVALAARGARAELLWAAIAGALAALVAGLSMGFESYAGYIGDISAVAAADLRNMPGLPLADILAGPKFLAITGLGLAAVILLRRSETPGLGLALLVLLPGFIYVTFQNFGNDPIWLLPFGIIALAAAGPAAMRVIGIAALLIGAPPLLNMASSTVRHFALDTSNYTAVIPRVPIPRGSIYTTNTRAHLANAAVAQDTAAGGLEPLAERVERPARTVFQGSMLPDCQMTVGLTGWYSETGSSLVEALPRNARLFVADVLSIQWSFALAEPLKGGAPWYYDGLPGIGTATHVLVPLCPVQPAARTHAIAELDAADLALSEVQTTPLYRLFEIQR